MNAQVISDRHLLRELLRREFPVFLRKVFQTLHPGEPMVENWHIDAICDVLRRTYTGELNRVLINVPPRHLKSIAVSVAFPAFVLGHCPTAKFLVASYGGDLALMLSRQFRTVVEADWYLDTFPEMRNVRRSVDGEFVTSKNGGRKAVSLGGPTTGFGADYIIVDDLMKAGEESQPGARETARNYFMASLMSRQNNPLTAKVIVIAQRLHEEDVPGHCLETGLYYHLNLPAIAEEREVIPIGRGRTVVREPGDLLFPTRFPRQWLDSQRLELGPTAFSAQYQQNPVPPESNLIRFSDIQRYEEAPLRRRLERVIQSWDTATTSNPGSDYSVCTTWGYYRERWYLLDLYRAKHDYPELLGAVRRLRDEWRADKVLMEKAGTAYAIFTELRVEMRFGPPVPWDMAYYTPKVDKITRFAAQTAKLMDGFGLFPMEATWMPELRKEILAFPNGRHDDQVDSISQFLDYAGRNPIAPPGGWPRRP